MTAPARPRAATSHLDLAFEHWHRATEIRDEWLGHGLSTAPADRPAAEAAVASLYTRLGRARPRFAWVASPVAAMPLVTGLPTHAVLHRWVTRPPSGPRPVASDLVASASRPRSALDERLEPPAFDPPPPRRTGKPPEPWPVLPAPELLRRGIPFREVLTQGVRDALRASLSLHVPVRAALGPPETVPVCFYGQQDAHWIAYYDAWRRLGLARYSRADGAQLDTWAALARAAGWWWPGDAVCVMVERPSAPRHEEVRPRRSGGPALVWRDGWP